MALAGALFIVAAAGLLVSCSSAGPLSEQSPTTPAGNERDIELKHEPCDMAAPTNNTVDVNGDGKPDIIHVLQGGREVCRVVDLNLDGAVDAFIYYDAQGFERRRESDFDRDGRPDEIAYLQGGVTFRKERETNFDSKIDTWDHYSAGRLMRRERDSDGDAIVDQWWAFNNPADPRCAFVASDRNMDGRPDPDTVVDLCGMSYGGLPLTPPPAGAAESPAGPPGAGLPPPAAPGSPIGGAAPPVPAIAPPAGSPPASAPRDR